MHVGVGSSPVCGMGRVSGSRIGGGICTPGVPGVVGGTVGVPGGEFEPACGRPPPASLDEQPSAASAIQQPNKETQRTNEAIRPTSCRTGSMKTRRLLPRAAVRIPPGGAFDVHQNPIKFDVGRSALRS
nr:MAG: hypothetical protein DIU78_00040 [Pseudomonadota bacterium]